MPENYGGFSKSGTMLEGGDGHLWWRRIDDLPEQENRDRVRQVIQDDMAAYKRLGYRIEYRESADANDVDIYIRHKRQPDHSDIALLEGAMSFTLARAGWGGPG